MKAIVRKRQINLTLSDGESEALAHLVDWRALTAADVIRGLITREWEISRDLTPLQADAAVAAACRNILPRQAAKEKR